MTTDPDFQVGGTVFPLDPSGAGIRVADKPIVACLKFCRSVINSNMGAAFQAELNKSPPIIIPSNLDGYIVAEICPFDPAEWIEEKQFKFPLLSIFREGKQTAKFPMLQQMSVEGMWLLQYIMPAMSFNEFRRLQGIPELVAKLLHRQLQDGDDQHFLTSDGYQTDWGVGVGIDHCYVDSYRVYHWRLPAEGVNTKGGPGLIFPVLEMTLKVRERDQMGPVTASYQLTGVDLEFDINPDII